MRLRYVVALVLLLFSLIAHASTRVIVEGHGSSETEAKQDAFNSAITQVVGQVIVSDKEASGDRLVKDFIGGYSAGYIENFETLEIRRVQNGFILVVNTEDDTREFVYDTERKLMRSVKQYLGEKVTAED
jgi:hypothetical protein